MRYATIGDRRECRSTLYMRALRLPNAIERSDLEALDDDVIDRRYLLSAFP